MSESITSTRVNKSWNSISWGIKIVKSWIDELSIEHIWDVHKTLKYTLYWYWLQNNNEIYRVIVKDRRSRDLVYWEFVIALVKISSWDLDAFTKCVLWDWRRYDLVLVICHGSRYLSWYRKDKEMILRSRSRF